MDKIVLKCNKCNRFYVCGEMKDIGSTDNLRDCGGQMFDTGITFNEYLIISKISQDVSLLQAMIDLKQKDIIEYNLKLNQFKLQVEQQSSSSNNTNVLKCPTCSSTRVKKISTTSKVAGAAMFGLFSKTARSQFKCEQCGYKW